LDCILMGKGRIEQDTVVFLVRLSREVRTRLEYHAKRIGANMKDIVREATMNHLDLLDEKERLAKQPKTKPVAYVPEVVPHPWGKPRGLGPYTPTSPAVTTAAKIPTTIIPDKIKGSFRRYAEFLEEAEDKIEIEQRTKTIREDMQDRTKSPDEVEA